MSSQEASKMLRTYNIAWWGNNYYDVNELGHISVCPDPDVPEARVDLAELVKAREAQGQRLPALFCFPQILQIIVIAPPGNIISTQHLAGFLGAHRYLLHGT